MSRKHIAHTIQRTKLVKTVEIVFQTVQCSPTESSNFSIVIVTRQQEKPSPEIPRTPAGLRIRTAAPNMPNR